MVSHEKSVAYIPDDPRFLVIEILRTKGPLVSHLTIVTNDRITSQYIVGAEVRSWPKLGRLQLKLV